MEPDRFKRRTDYGGLPPRRPESPPATIGGIDQVRPPSAPAPSTHAVAPQPAVVNNQNNAPRPVWAQPRSTAVVSTPATAAPASADPTTIAVHISLPKLRRPHLPSLQYKRIAIWAAIACVVLGLIAGGVVVAGHFIHKSPQAASLSGNAAAIGRSLAKPTYAPVVPVSKPSLAVSSTTSGAAFDGTKNAYSYNDTFMGTGLTVSEQPMPSKGYPSTQAAIDKIAQNIGARTPVKVPNGTTGYLSNDVKSGNNIVVFTLNDLLVFIQSPFTHSASDWQLYIASLK